MTIKVKKIFKKIKNDNRIKRFLLIICILLLVSLSSFFIGKKVGMNTDSSTTNTKIEDVVAKKETIKKSLSSTGEIQTTETEKLSLNKSYYFSKMYVEENDIVLAGETILKYTNGKKLTAPYDCVIASVNVPDSKSKATDSNFIEIKNFKELKVSLNISESEIININEGTEVDITLTSDSSKKYTGLVSKISSIGTYSSSGTTFSVEVSLENDGNIKLGMSVNCVINIEEKTDVLTVPIEAVQINGNRRYVIVVSDNETKEVEVTTGLSDDENVEIKSGINIGDVVRVITTTKQSTIRSDSSNSFGGMSNGFSNGGFNPESSGDKPQMPSNGMPRNER